MSIAASEYSPPLLPLAVDTLISTFVQVIAHRLKVESLKEIYGALQDAESKDAWISALREKVSTFEECLAEIRQNN